MSTRLRDEDGRAVDIVLDRTFKAADTRNTGGNGSGSVLPQRIGAVEQILNALAAMPAVEPPATLVQDTLEYIDRHSLTGGAAAMQSDIQNPHLL